jgi:hypothetical protein
MSLKLTNPRDWRDPDFEPFRRPRLRSTLALRTFNRNSAIQTRSWPQSV